MKHSRKSPNVYASQLKMRLLVTFFILPLLFIVEQCRAQQSGPPQPESECPQLVSYEEDKVTGSTTITAPKEIIVCISEADINKGIGMYWMLLNKGRALEMALIVSGGGCIEQGAMVNVLFTDGTRLQIKGHNQFNCKGSVALYFGGSYGYRKSILNEFLSKQIETIRIHTADSYIEQDLTADQSLLFMKSGQCIASLTK
jgi:hypothetical protein